MPLLDPQRLLVATGGIFAAAGVPADAARIVAEHLVDSDACGVSSHGVIRVPQYIEAIEEGRVIADARLAVRQEGLATAVLDGGLGFGQVMAREATQVAVDRAKRVGAAAVTLVNCGHTGRLGYYTERAAWQGLAMIMMSNTGGCGQWVAPFGGVAGRLATNPISIAVPAESADPLLLDMATSVAPEGRVRAMLSAGKPVPRGWLIDANGKGTTNPADLYGPPRGALLPFGGHKGFGLSMLVDALAGGLSGAGCCIDADSPMAGYTDGVLMIAVDIAAFIPLDEFRALIDRQVAHIKSAAPADGAVEVLVPGELEARTRRQRSESGIPVDEGTWLALGRLAERFHVSFAGVVREDSPA